MNKSIKHAVAVGLAGFLERSPDSASVEDLRRFQLHMVDQGSSPITLNATITGLKFFFEVTLDRGELMAKMSPVRVPHTLPACQRRVQDSGSGAAGNTAAAFRGMYQAVAVILPKSEENLP